MCEVDLLKKRKIFRICNSRVRKLLHSWSSLSVLKAQADLPRPH
ncbi:hypothetical protein ABID77_003207 [Variovorax sp. PvP013]